MAGERKESAPSGRVPQKSSSFRRRLIGWLLAILALLGSLGFAALSLRSCMEGAILRFRQETETRIYQYGASLSREAKILLAEKQSGFVIPRDFVKKLVLGLKSTAKIEISCQASIHYYVDLEDLRQAEKAWEGRNLTLRLAPPRALRPIIESSSIRQAILDHGLLFNERAELDILLSELSDIVASQADLSVDEPLLETCRSSLEEILSQAFLGQERAPDSLRVEWKG
jgi:hypothetical protein